MKASNDVWKERLRGDVMPQLAEEIDVFEMEIHLRRQEKVDEKLFAETRLRRGVYGQRYDNGQRNDGTASRTLEYEQKATKGPNTIWDAPGMQRIKIPYGGTNATQLEVLAELAEEYSDGIVHITTRQDFQLHYVHVENTPTVMRRLAAVGITTREACGNSIRNVTGCPYMGVCADEAFDVTPYAHALTQFMLGHPDAQNFGRKFKPTFSGCAEHACGLTGMHDLGLTAVTRVVDGQERRGFQMVVGGGLGAVPRQAKVFDEFLAPEEILPLTQAMARVFGKHGEKKTRSRARLKFLIEKWGMDKFKEEVLAERGKLPPDPRWTEYLQDIEDNAEGPLRDPGELPAIAAGSALERWVRSNLRGQRQDGYVVATVALPLGDITAFQLRALADIVRRFTKDTIRTTVEQNFVLRWISQCDVPDLYEALDAVGLAEPGASNVFDIVACPGTDTCKLGISSSRGLAAELRQQLVAKSVELEQAIEDLHIKISGCFNSCGQHHIADIGFYGVSRTIGGYKVPHFQVVLGGQWEANAASYGLPIVAVPSKRIPQALDLITGYYMENRSGEERFPAFVVRMGKAAIRTLLDGLTKDPPEHETQPEFYSDWGDPRQYSLGDIGKGECAGEVVTQFEFEIGAAERTVFESQVHLEGGRHQEAGDGAYLAMVKAAKALVQLQYDDVTENDVEEIVEEFKERYYDNEAIFDPFAGPKFADYFFAAHNQGGGEHTSDSAHTLIEESHLFLEAVHSCYNRIRSEGLSALGANS